MAGLPKSYIKKYGVTKKAWAIFRASKGVSLVKRRVKRRVKTMARRFKRSYRRSSGFGMSGLVKPALIGVGVAMLGSSIMPEVDNRLKAGAVGYFMGGGVKGALVSAVSAHVAPSILGGVTSQSSVSW